MKKFYLKEFLSNVIKPIVIITMLYFALYSIVSFISKFVPNTLIFGILLVVLVVLLLRVARKYYKE